MTWALLATALALIVSGTVLAETRSARVTALVLVLIGDALAAAALLAEVRL